MNQTFEPGQYHCRVTRWSLVKAKTGTPHFVLSFLPVGKVNPHNPDGDLEDCPEYERTIFRPVTEKTASWLLQDLKALFDYPDERFSPLDPESPDAFDFHDREFTAALTYEEYEGRTRERWNFASGAGLLYGNPMTEAEVRKLDTLFGAAKPKRRGRKAAATQPEAAEQPAVEQAESMAAMTPPDKIPF